MTVGDINRIRIVSIHADEVLHFRFGTPERVTRWRPLARDRADLPPALRVSELALVTRGPGQTADFTYVPERSGPMAVEVWINRGQRVVLPVEVRVRAR